MWNDEMEKTDLSAGETIDRFCPKIVFGFIHAKGPLLCLLTLATPASLVSYLLLNHLTDVPCGFNPERGLLR